MHQLIQEKELREKQKYANGSSRFFTSTVESQQVSTEPMSQISAAFFPGASNPSVGDNC
ncbi:TPA: hypothetical protein ACTUT5_001905 [Legionella anisa]|uniref:hypothetical protein n=1 Tax=Legionella anisa TaxID=28082 RepID=UPI00034A5264|nr:hypothetical protein [Legionella anisa]MBN5935347.1 hypothetical protein [Legionella anisa]MCW8426384.1 hypothetical protein [Legionella anisa]MCW8448044.1 hypothetical protein [Legionella anisa]UAK78671.1 hypothetical protein K8O89_13515 [Legionella anisa]